MSKAIRIAKLSAKGGFNLFLGISLSSVISALGVIILARLFTPSQYGLYTIVLMPASLITLFRDWGMNSAMIKYVAQYRSEGRTVEMRKVIASGLLFELVAGIFMSVTTFFLAGLLAKDVFHRPEIEPLVRLTSVTVLAGALLTAAQSAFIGSERMELNSITMICRSALGSLLPSLLVLLGYGTLGAILGYTTAIVIVGILAILVLYLAFRRNLGIRSQSGPELSTTLKRMLRYGLPVAISAFLGGILSQFYNFMIAIYCTNFMIGNYHAALNFTVLITFFATPIATVLFPAFSKLNREKEIETLRIVFKSSIKYAAVVVVPASIALVVFSRPLVFTLFGESYSYAPFFLSLCAIRFLYSALGNLSLPNFLAGQGKTIVGMKLSFLTLAIGFPSALLLVPRFGITGLIATTLLTGFISIVAGLWWVRKHFGVTVDWLSSIKILAAASIAAAVAHLLLYQLDNYSWTSLVIGGTTFFLAYLIATPLTRALNLSDMDNIRQILSELGPLAHLSKLPLVFIEKLMIISQKKRT